MENWWNNNFFVAIFASVLSIMGTFVVAWWRLKGQGVSAINANEIIDRARFRKDLMDRLDQQNRVIVQLEQRLLRTEAAEMKCMEQNRQLRARVLELENAVKRLHPGTEFKGELPEAL